MRAEQSEDVEYRSINDEVNVEEVKGEEPENDFYKYENRYLESLI